MEVILVGSILTAGYLLQKDGINRTRTTIEKLTLPDNAKPNGPDPYTDHRSVTIWQNEQEKANRLYEEAKDSINTNVMIPGPPLPIFNKADGAQRNQIPMTFKTPAQMALANQQTTKKLEQNELPQPTANWQTNDMTVISDGKYAVDSGWAGIDLMGNVIQKSEFHHNNEVPFFGGTVRQNVDDNASRRTLEEFSGTNENYQQKQEVSMNVFSPPVANLGNPYGTSNLEGYNVERYWVSGVRNNEAPTEPIRVGPGLNKGYTNLGSGGFQQANTRDYVLPKTVDEMRVLTNPKVTFAGRVIPGQKIGKTGKVGLLQKYRPTSYFENGPERFFVTTGQTVAPAMRPTVDLPVNQRGKTAPEMAIGPAGPTSGSKPDSKRSITAPSRKRNYRSDPVRNVTARSQRAMTLENVPNDYGKATVQLRCTQRPELKSFPVVKQGAVTSVLGPKGATKLRFTRKMMQIGNLKWGGNIKGAEQLGVVWDPNNRAKVTIKETTENDDHIGIAAGPDKGHVVDPNNRAKTTVKETTENDGRVGVASGMERGKVWDPNDRAKVTIKETTENDDHIGGAAPGDNVRGGYTQMEAGLDVPWTARDTTLTSYTGGAYSKTNEGNGYANAHAGTVAPTTHRQQTVTSYVGIQGPGSHEASRSRGDIENATTHSNRENVSKGRTPAAGGPKRIPAKDSVVLTTMPDGAINDALADRAPAPVEQNPLYYRAPEGESTMTKEKESVPNQPLADRIEPAILDAFRSNPFTQSLASYFFA